MMPTPFSILVFNAGSSSLKFALFEVLATGFIKPVIRGTVSDIGGVPVLDWSDGTAHGSTPILVHSQQEATDCVLDWLQNLWPFGSLLERVTVVAHRIVHGGIHLSSPIIVTDKVMAQLDQLTPLAPLHNPQAMVVMRESQNVFSNKIFLSDKTSRKVMTVAVFDTAFFSHLPQYTHYALPEILLKQHHIQRFGFHGFAHRYMVQRYCALRPDHAQQHQIISFQLGSGCSVTASQNGKPVDTSMGFTPLEGLVMATRAGDIDPGLLIYLLKHGHSLDELEDLLQHQSGLLGIAKTTGDMLSLLDLQDTDEDAKLAVDMFCYRARKYLGAYMAVLGKVDAVIFGGGIGEHSHEIRQRICANMDWCGMQIDEQRNQLADQSSNSLAHGTEMLISADTSKISVYVIAVNEELVIAEDARTEAMHYQSGVINVVFSDYKQHGAY